MSETSDRRSEDFLKISDQFQLGVLTTESSHPVTTNLSETAKRSVPAALGLLFEADGDIVRKYREFAKSGGAASIKDSVLRALKNGGKVFFTGCGSTGRLSIQLVSIWRDFWQQQRARGLNCSPAPEEFEHRALSVMAGGDFALIKSVEGFEDFTEFGRKQIADLGVGASDVVFAITEGGETSFVIGTAWQGLEAGAKVYFVYNNPDDILCQHVKRSREVIQEPRIEKLNLTTGPMSITGSTRMQATTIQLCVMLTVLEMVLRDLMRELEPEGPCALDSASVPTEFLKHLETMHANLMLPEFRSQLASVVSLEESVYRSGHKNTYLADRFGIDVLTDTTERSPTYCTPPFRKFDDTTATESWSFLFVPSQRTPTAWERIIKRPPKCVEWTEQEVRALVPEDKVARTCEILRKIGTAELMRFKVGLDGLKHRPLGKGDSAVGIISETEKASLLSPDGFHRRQLEAAQQAGAQIGIIYVGREESFKEVSNFLAKSARFSLKPPSPSPWPSPSGKGEALGGGGRCLSPDGLSQPAETCSLSPGERARVRGKESLDCADAVEREHECAMALAPVPNTGFLLDGVTRAGLKMLLNALSTCTMVRLGRVMGNYMIWVVPSNLKLIDRATRYIQKLAGLDYRAANRLLFEVVEYVEPRMKADQAYPPVVGLAVMRARRQLGNAEAEQRLMVELSS
jgi:N-acetylmuramic acid 6-phosphate etherase